MPYLFTVGDDGFFCFCMAMAGGQNSWPFSIAGVSGS
jgi:hypothetical protein